MQFVPCRYSAQSSDSQEYASKLPLKRASMERIQKTPCRVLPRLGSRRCVYSIWQFERVAKFIHLDDKFAGTSLHFDVIGIILRNRLRALGLLAQIRPLTLKDTQQPTKTLPVLKFHNPLHFGSLELFSLELIERHAYRRCPLDASLSAEVQSRLARWQLRGGRNLFQMPKKAPGNWSGGQSWGTLASNVVKAAR